MNMPLSDAETTFMPELHPATVPLHVARNCGWCGIPLTAIPDPVIEHQGLRFHDDTCLAAHLLTGGSKQVRSSHRGPSDPR